jgi:hypothetical protein
MAGMFTVEQPPIINTITMIMPDLAINEFGCLGIEAILISVEEA